MCGIVGFVQPVGDNATEMMTRAASMASLLAHRGPDDAGTWSDPETGVALAHRRLSILDLSEAGHQPMQSRCGRFVIVFNGEIYNHLELRQQLEATGHCPDWRGHSDTESLLETISAWGILDTLRAAVGMFAIALWDRKEKSLTLARDRAGEKPLYYGWQRNRLLFTSELKALRAYTAFEPEIDRNAIALLLRHNNVPAPHSIFKGIRKLIPGHYVTIAASREESGEPVAYWKLDDVIADGTRDQFKGTETEAITEMEQQLCNSIRSQMLSDVPLGAFLSGGIDSSLVVALMQSHSDTPVNTFTIGFHDSDYDEAAYARAIAAHVGTHHTELYVTAEDALSVIPGLPTIYCEPFADSSQIPTYLVSNLASKHVKVSLTGDGGDELFGGYNRYLMAMSVWRRFRRLPKWMSESMGNYLRSRSASEWDALFGHIAKLLPGRLKVRNVGDKAHKLAGALRAEDGGSFYRHLISHFDNPLDIVLDATEPLTLTTSTQAMPSSEKLVDWMMAMDFQTYLTDDILTKVDRAAMANSLESRVPYLDHRVVELAWRMPASLKIRNGEGKWLLRQILSRYVPENMFDRPKMGFANPLHQWLRGPLREWAEELLDRSRLEKEGFFDPEPIREMWKAHLCGASNEQHSLWIVLMFQAWLAEQ